MPEVQATDYLNVGRGTNTNNELANSWYRFAPICWDIP
jgi:hypothetical protein